jgi:zinc protease
VASLSAAVQRAGGSTALPGDALDDALEQRAAYIEVHESTFSSP